MNDLKTLDATRFKLLVLAIFILATSQRCCLLIALDTPEGI